MFQRLVGVTPRPIQCLQRFLTAARMEEQREKLHLNRIRLSQHFFNVRPDTDTGTHFGGLCFTFRSMIYQKAVHPVHEKMAKGKLRHCALYHKGNAQG